MSQTPMIQTSGLTKTFTRHKQRHPGAVEAVRGLDLVIAEGELVAFLGPNGAGKSTTLRMLTTLIPPSAGSATVAGYDVVREQRQVRRSIGFVGQGNAASHQQRGRDEVISQARAHGLRAGQAAERADELLATFDLAEHASRPVSTLSGGQRRRLDIAIGMVHRPRLMFLDEPSTGLDPQNRANLQEQVVRLNREFGTTVVLTTHYLEEADAIADRVIVIDHGRVIADDSAEALKSGLGDVVTMRFGSAADAATAAQRAAALWGEDAVETRGDVVGVRAPRASQGVPGLVTDLAGHGTPVVGLTSVSATLDDVFLHLTGRSLRETGADNTPEITAENTSTEGVAA